MPELQWHRFEEPVCRVSRGPFLGKYELAFARRGRRSRRARRCNWQGDDARNATERPFQEGQSPDKMVIRQVDLVVGRNLVRGTHCVRAFGHVASWAGVVFSGDSIRRDFPRSLSSSGGRSLAT
jgi:hypothetical protein